MAFIAGDRHVWNCRPSSALSQLRRDVSNRANCAAKISPETRCKSVASIVDMAAVAARAVRPSSAAVALVELAPSAVASTLRRLHRAHTHHYLQVPASCSARPPASRPADRWNALDGCLLGSSAAAGAGPRAERRGRRLHATSSWRRRGRCLKRTMNAFRTFERAHGDSEKECKRPDDRSGDVQNGRVPNACTEQPAKEAKSAEQAVSWTTSMRKVAKNHARSS